MAIVITWIPVAGLTDVVKEQQTNEEHLAATAAMTQNLLLMAEAHGYPGYWASAGLINKEPVRRYLGIGAEEKICSVVYISPGGASIDGATLLSGGNRPVRTPYEKWTREL